MIAGLDISTRAISPTDAAWLAGFLDGEGTFAIGLSNRRETPSYEPCISAANTNRALLERCKELCGGNIGNNRSSNERARESFRWEVRARSTVRVLEAVAPFIVGKREQVSLLLELRRSIDEPANRGRNYRVDRVPPDVVAWRRQLKLAMHALNARGTATPPQEHLDALSYVRATLIGPTQLAMETAA